MASAQLKDWSPTSWKNKTALQQPHYHDETKLREALTHISSLPPLVHFGEVENLRSQIAEAGKGRRFVLQAGDCAERFVDCNAKSIEDKVKIILQMSLILIHGLRKPIVRIGRIAGQYAKPRSDGSETVNGKSLPSFRGDIINGYAFEDDARQHDPQRMVEAFIRSGLTLNHIRALIEGGFADVRHPEMWRLEHLSEKDQPQLYLDVSARVREATSFMELLVGEANPDTLKRVEFFTSHEALLLDYESALTQKVSPHARGTATGWFNSGAPFLWLGERTRQLDGAHAEYLRGIENPIGIKVGPTADPAEIVALCKHLNPLKIPGKITIITRMGSHKIKDKLPSIVQEITRSQLEVTWSCDPMHGNVIKTQNGIKTRDFSAILDELKSTYGVHRAVGTCLGGVHFELTGENVTECTGGGQGLMEEHLTQNYTTYCDPRLNYSQSMEIAYLLADHLGQP